MKQNYIFIREKDICPTFFYGADLRFQGQYKDAIYHDQMDIIEQLITNKL